MSQGLHPVARGGRLSLLSAHYGLGVETYVISVYVWTVHVHPGINNGRIGRKHISLLWVGREGRNDQTISLPLKWLSHFPCCGTQSNKTIIVNRIF